MNRFALTPHTTLIVRRGDLTQFNTAAIVNAANEALAGGGGVDGAIHRAAGPDLLAACRALPEVRPGVRCPTGEARLTEGFGLPARYVIHAVGPVYESPETSAPLLHAAYTASLQLAREHGLATVAFPAISCGVYGYPLAEAAPIAIEACRTGADGLTEIHFALFDEAAERAWLAAARRATDVA